MDVKRSEGLLMSAQPLEAAEEISRRIVDVRVVDGTLLLDADPAWAGASNTVPTQKGVSVNGLREVSDISLPEEEGPLRSACTLSERPAMWMRQRPSCAIIYLRRERGAVSSGRWQCRPKAEIAPASHC